MINVKEELISGRLIATRELCIFSQFVHDDPDTGIAWFHSETSMRQVTEPATSELSSRSTHCLLLISKEYL